jgi:hypothetical protein
MSNTVVFEDLIFLLYFQKYWIFCFRLNSNKTNYVKIRRRLIPNNYVLLP